LARKPFQYDCRLFAFSKRSESEKKLKIAKKILEGLVFFFVKSCLKLGRDSDFFSRERPNFKTKNTPKNNP